MAFCYLIKQCIALLRDYAMSIQKKSFFADKYAFYEEVCESIDVCYISNFDGEAVRIQDDGHDDYYSPNNTRYYSDDTIYFLPLVNYPGLFSAPYKDMAEVVAEMKERIGKYLPEDFDYIADIRHIIGTYFG